jgi:hypothetical protein
VARRLLEASSMKNFATLATLAIAVLAVSAPALADAPPQRSDPMKVRISLKDGSAVREFNVIIPTDGPCASATQKAPDRQFEFKACPSHDAHLVLDWFVRSANTEYRSTSSIPFEHGSIAELGSTTGPRLTVTIE